jgi:hypothetical protein
LQASFVWQAQQPGRWLPRAAQVLITCAACAGVGFIIGRGSIPAEPGGMPQHDAAGSPAVSQVIATPNAATGSRDDAGSKQPEPTAQEQPDRSSQPERQMARSADTTDAPPVRNDTSAKKPERPFSSDAPERSNKAKRTSAADAAGHSPGATRKIDRAAPKRESPPIMRPPPALARPDGQHHRDYRELRSSFLRE